MGIAEGEEAQHPWCILQAAIFAQSFLTAGAASTGCGVVRGPAMGVARPTVINASVKHQSNSLGPRTVDKKDVSAIGATGMRRKKRKIETIGHNPRR
jgi:hypothetical protein